VIRRLFTLGVVAAVLLGADLTARGFVSSAMTHRAQQEAPAGSTVTASVRGFPFLPPLLLGGTVKGARVHVANLTADVLVFSEIDVDLTGVHLDRGKLINDRKARITSIDHGTISATITADELSKALRGVPVVMTEGKMTVAGLTVTPSVRNRRLAIGAFTVPLSNYMPCVSSVSVKSGEMELACTINEIPPALLDAVQRTLDR
jgi:hypothetical protein